MIAGIEKEELVLLKFTEEEKQSLLKWKHAKEFEFDGEMYDIVEFEVKNDTCYYWCWYDHAETKLNKQLDELLTFTMRDNLKHQESKNRLNVFFKSLYFAEHIDKKNFSLLAITNGLYSHTSLYQSVYYSPPNPPPKLG